jgi:hypothetical protein
VREYEFIDDLKSREVSLTVLDEYEIRFETHLMKKITNKVSKKRRKEDNES